MKMPTKSWLQGVSENTVDAFNTGAMWKLSVTTKFDTSQMKERALLRGGRKSRGR